MFLFRGAEPVLPKNDTNQMRRSRRKGIAREEPKHVRIIPQKRLLGPRHDKILLPGAEGGKPEIPVQAWLIRCIDTWAFIESLGLVALRICNPMLSVVGSLELDLGAMRRHNGEQAILIGDTEGFERSNRFCRK